MDIMTKTEFQADHYQNLYPEGIEFQYWQIARNKTLLKEVKNIYNRLPTKFSKLAAVEAMYCSICAIRASTAGAWSLLKMCQYWIRLSNIFK
jgi:hypothetical protein